MQFLKFVGGYSQNTDCYFLSGIEIKKIMVMDKCVTKLCFESVVFQKKTSP